MATKKKPAKKAVKKATKKIAKKAVKRPAKKAVKKATRKYTKRVVKKAPVVKKPRQARKKKTEEQLPIGLAVEGADNTAAVMGCSDCEKAALNFVDSIGALDMRYSPIPERFAILLFLGQLGYLATNLGPLVFDLDNLNVMLKADSLRLNHTNKIVVAGLWEDIQDVTAIATVHASTHSDIHFDKPRPAYPESYFIGDAEYQRIR
jgi:hypothetical protein